MMVQDNYFNLPNPENLNCHIAAYELSHSKLKINIYKYKEITPSWSVGFIDVKYIEASVSWSSANFILANSSEILKLCYNLKFNKDMSDEIVLKYNLLFYIKPLDKDILIKILAARGSISTI